MGDEGFAGRLGKLKSEEIRIRREMLESMQRAKNHCDIEKSLCVPIFSFF